MSRAEPPRLARLLLERALPHDLRDDVVGDLDEVYQRRLRERGALWAGVWYARQSVAFAARFALQRFRERRALGLDDLGRDLLTAVRRMRARPGAVVVVVLTLALGLGANASMFQIVEALHLRTVSVADPERWTIVEIADMSRWQGRRTTGYPVLSHALWESIRDGRGPFDATLAWASTTFFLEDSGSPTVVRGLYVSGGFFDALGVAPVVGRTFGPADDRRGCGLQGVVLGYGFWQRAFGGDPAVVGRRVALDTHPVPIVGVAAEGFAGLEVGRAFDVAVPICAEEVLGDGEQWIANGTVFWLTVMGRVPPSQPLRSVNAQLDAWSPALLEATLPDQYTPDGAEAYLGLSLRAIPGATGVSSLRIRYGSSFVTLLGVTALVLLIVCTNLANLFLARGAAREREFAVRRALGASRGRLLRELSIESAVLAAAGAAVGLALASTLSRSLLGPLGPDLSLDLSLGGLTVAFVVAAAGVSSLTFGLLPAWLASRGGCEHGLGGLREGRGAAAAGRGADVRRWLVVSQVALSFVLVFAALLFTTTLRNLLAVDSGYEAEGVAVARVDFRNLDLPDASRTAFKRDLLERVRDVAGVASADEVRHVPMGGTGSSANVRAGDGTSISVRLNAVTNAYVETAGLPLLAGRGFAPDDAPEAPLAIVTPAFAMRVGLGSTPVGRRFVIETGELGEGSSMEIEIIGLVPDAKYFNLREAPVPTAFVPKALLPDSRPYTDFMVRTPLPPQVLHEALRAAVADGSPVVWTDVRPFDDTIHAGLVRERLLSTVSGFLGALAALVAAIGLYGVMSHQVAQRKSEIGVRIALGARRRDILLMVLGQAGALVAVGVALGGVLALVASAPVRSLLFGLEANMAPMLVIAAGVLAATGALASYVPARRAARLEPQTALTLE